MLFVKKNIKQKGKIMTLVGKKAPDFTATAALKNTIIEGFNLLQFRGKYVIFFFYPLDFTFVCPTELLAFQDKYEHFKALNCEIVGCSRDSHYTHLAWLNTKVAEGGILGVSFPLVADMKLEISRDYKVLKEESGLSYRGLFLIDREGVVRHTLVNDLPLGRSIDEAFRILEAFQHFEKNGEMCPANWKEGQKGIKK
jgi:peroxiredoxin (alkyl hydroperoxide reductase subunit C)